MSALPKKRWAFGSTIKAVLHRFVSSHASVLSCCGQEEIERIAREIRMSPAELSIIIRRGPEAANLLLKRMAALDLDPKEVSQIEPQTFRELQRSCALCESKRRCGRDLKENTDSVEWKDYCPNATTLLAIDALPWKSRKEW